MANEISFQWWTSFFHNSFLWVGQSHEAMFGFLPEERPLSGLPHTWGCSFSIIPCWFTVLSSHPNAATLLLPCAGLWGYFANSMYDMNVLPSPPTYPSPANPTISLVVRSSPCRTPGCSSPQIHWGWCWCDCSGHSQMPPALNSSDACTDRWQQLSMCTVLKRKGRPQQWPWCSLEKLPEKGRVRKKENLICGMVKFTEQKRTGHSLVNMVGNNE